MGGGIGHEQWFNLARKKITFVSLSPFEQKAFPNPGKEFTHEFMRMGKIALKLAPFVFGTVWIINWANEQNRLLHRKNPADFEPGAAKPAH